MDYKDNKCRHLKNGPEKRLCGRCLLEFIDWRYSQSCWHFRPSFVNYCPSNLLSGSPPPPFPCVKKYGINIQFVAVRGWRLLGPVGDHILQEFNTLYLKRFRTYKTARALQTKLRKEGGLRQINTCRKVPLQVQFLETTFCIPF